MNLKPQDIFALLKLIAIGNHPWSYAGIAVDLGMSPSEVHGAIKRTLQARLAVQYNRQIKPNTKTLGEFLIHGIRYVFVPDKGTITRGLPTLSAAPPLNAPNTPNTPNTLNTGPANPLDDLPPVWPDQSSASAEDTPKSIRGQSFSPLYPSAPFAARRDNTLYTLLVLTDALRGGNTREQTTAALEIQKQLDAYRSLQ